MASTVKFESPSIVDRCLKMISWFCAFKLAKTPNSNSGVNTTNTMVFFDIIIAPPLYSEMSNSY